MSVSARYIGSSSGRRSRITSEVALDGLPVPTGERPGELEVVVHRPAHEREERLGRRPGLLEELRCGPVERDEEALGHDCGRVVDEARPRPRAERAEAKQVGEVESRRRGRRRLLPLTAAQAPSSCSGPRWRTKVWSGCRLKRRTCGSSASRVRAPLVWAIHGSDRNRRRDLVDDPVGNAEDDEVGVADLQLATGQASGQRLGEPRGEGGADASRADDTG